MPSLIKEYFKIQEESEKKFGDKTVIVMHVGGFYEVYSYEGLGKADVVANECNMMLTSKDKSKEISITNPQMCGFPLASLLRYMYFLTSKGFTCVTVKQDEKVKEKRTIDRIFSPGTCVDDSESSIVASIYADDGCIAVSWIDLTSGKVMFEEIYNDNEAYRREELTRIIETCGCKEIICMSKNGIMYDDAHEIDFCNIYEHISHQNDVISRAYPNDSTVSPIEFIDMEMFHIARVSLILLIEWVEDHHQSLIQRIRIPERINRKSLALHNTSVHQLQLVSQDKKSLFDVINKTNTSMGKMLLKQTLLNPYSDVSKLNGMYEDIERISKVDVEVVKKVLKNIGNVDRLARRIANKSINLEDIRHLILCFENGLDIIEHMRELSVHNMISENDVKRCYIAWHSTIDMEKDVFREGVYDDVDILKKERDTIMYMMDANAKRFSKTLGVNEGVKFELHKGTYGLITTPGRAKTLKNRVGNNVVFQADCKQKVVISTPDIQSLIHKLHGAIDAYDECMEEKMKEFVEILYSYHEIICTFGTYIAQVDVLLSHYLVAKAFNYTKPVVKEGDKSYITGKNIRHAIVERLNGNTLYMGNDVDLSNEKGLLLYGVNGSGKSCFSKSVGICVIMAQIGMFVPAETFEFCPYERIFTRISSEDNIYKGQSSFYVEMMEMNTILRFANEKSLIIGDEICKGTENISAISIVASMCNMISKIGATFVFATHLHGLVDLEPIKQIIDTIQIKHIGVTIESGVVTYDRHIKNGEGEHLYGLEIATHILGNKEFASLALETRNALLKKTPPKKSKYNARVLKKVCHICGRKDEQLDTHHINYQCDAHENIKNTKGNLVVLCKKCHDDEHHGFLSIKGWKDTSKGVILDYEFVSEK
tara:strand:+ start:15320 stop:17959 length:2640 start_codon:yes stop_codon:yes gene_type:complete